jgi:hypothetical protein
MTDQYTNEMNEFIKENGPYPNVKRVGLLKQIIYKYDRAAYDVFRTLYDRYLLQAETETLAYLR